MLDSTRLRNPQLFDKIVTPEEAAALITDGMNVEGISSELSAAKVGKQLKVIIDRIEGDYYIGRTEFDSPEVDPEVLINRADQTLLIGHFYQIEVIDSDDFDLFGKII